MLSKNMMIVFLAAYVILAIVSLFEKQHNRFIYWSGASLIQYAVIKMGV